MLSARKMEHFLSILQEELIPATGCTEPIAIAYCAAKLRQVLEAEPQEILAEVSGNILKNVKSVIVPNTGGRKGVAAAVAVGVVAGDADKELQVINDVPPEKCGEITAYLERTPIRVVCPEGTRVLDIRLSGRAGQDTALVHIANGHKNIVRIEKNGKTLMEAPLVEPSKLPSADDACALNVADILGFVNSVDFAALEPLVGQQIRLNSAIAEEGLRGNWGANIGSILLSSCGDDIRVEARAWAAAGSDARMSGCELPVCIVSGSGNQGITASLPVLRYAKHIGADYEKTCRAVALSDLVTIHQKTGIGRLSAYCGAISAGTGAGAGIAYLLDGSYDAIAHTIVNAVAILSGTICDGAKASCAAKISSAVDAGIFGYDMFCHQREFCGGDGIVTKGVDNTIANVGRLAREGMQQTDRTILEIMTKD